MHRWLPAFGAELAPENAVDADEEKEGAADENRCRVSEDGNVDADGFEGKVGAREVNGRAGDGPRFFRAEKDIDRSESASGIGPSNIALDGFGIGHEIGDFLVGVNAFGGGGTLSLEGGKIKRFSGDDGIDKNEAAL